MLMRELVWVRELELPLPGLHALFSLRQRPSFFRCFQEQFGQVQIPAPKRRAFSAC
jgi:hypothetical protein